MIFLIGAGLLIVVMRGGAPQLAIGMLFALVAFVAVAQSAWSMGPGMRIARWWVAVFAVAIALAVLFRLLDAG